MVAAAVQIVVHHFECFASDEEGTVSATDVIANNISISAPSRQLLIDASLKLVSGRRYGLLGPNGRYKTFSSHFTHQVTTYCGLFNSLGARLRC